MSESSLTTPSDRDKELNWQPNQHAKKLTIEQTINAVKDLYINTLDSYPKIDRLLTDPPIQDQTHSLFSFVPAKGATPNQDGIFGFAKFRGVFSNAMDATQRAEYIIRHVDSYHQIFITPVGKPYPITLDSKYSAKVNEIDLRKEIEETLSEDVKTQRLKEAKEKKQIEEREKALKEDVKKTDDPYESYVTNKVKRAHLIFTYQEYKTKMAEIKENIEKTIKVLDETETEHPDFSEKYLETYLEARKSAGLDNSTDSNNFIKYLDKDAHFEW